MKPHHYHQLLGQLDRTLEIFDRANAELSLDDLQLRLQVAKIRAQVSQPESGAPLALDTSELHTAIDPDLTPPPWSKMIVSDPNLFPSVRVG